MAYNACSGSTKGRLRMPNGTSCTSVDLKRAGCESLPVSVLVLGYAFTLGENTAKISQAEARLTMPSHSCQPGQSSAEESTCSLLLPKVLSIYLWCWEENVCPCFYTLHEQHTCKGTATNIQADTVFLFRSDQGANARASTSSHRRAQDDGSMYRSPDCSWCSGVARSTRVSNGLHPCRSRRPQSRIG